jgi:hypothetical protein
MVAPKRCTDVVDKSPTSASSVTPTDLFTNSLNHRIASGAQFSEGPGRTSEPGKPLCVEMDGLNAEPHIRLRGNEWGFSRMI